MKLSSHAHRCPLFVELLEDRAVPGYALPTTFTATLAGAADAWLSERDAATFDNSSGGAEHNQLARLIAWAREEGPRPEHPGTTGSMAQLARSSTLSGSSIAIPPVPTSAPEALVEAAGFVQPVLPEETDAALENEPPSSTLGPGPTLAPPFDGSYALTDLDAVPGLPTPYGGLTLLAGNSNTLLIGGNANSGSGDAAVYSIGVTRNAQLHINGFVGQAQFYADAAYIDGGLAYGPGNVLFYARWPTNEMGQIPPNSTRTTRVDDLVPYGIAGSVGAPNFVPAGHPGQGQMKLVSWAGGEFNTAALVPDGRGTYRIYSAKQQTQIGGGPEGFAHVPQGSPLFSRPSMLVSEWSVGLVGAYETDAQGNPIPQTRRDFIQGLSGAEGAYVDPLTGDFLFSTFGGGDRVIVVRGFARP